MWETGIISDFSIPLVEDSRDGVGCQDGGCRAKRKSYKIRLYVLWGSWRKVKKRC